MKTNKILTKAELIIAERLHKTILEQHSWLAAQDAVIESVLYTGVNKNGYDLRQAIQAKCTGINALNEMYALFRKEFGCEYDQCQLEKKAEEKETILTSKQEDIVDWIKKGQFIIGVA